MKQEERQKKTLEEWKEEFRKKGNQLQKRGRNYTHDQAKKLYQEFSPCLDSHERKIVKEALLKLGTSTINWESRGDFVAELYYLKQESKDLISYIKEVVEASIHHLQTTDDTLEGPEKLCQDELLDFSKFIQDGTVKFQAPEYQNRIPVLETSQKERVEASDFFLADINELAAQYVPKTSLETSYSQETMAEVLKQSPILPVFLLYSRDPYQIETEVKDSNQVVFYGCLKKDTDGIFQSTPTPILEEEHLIDQMNLATFLMVKENMTLGQAIDTLIVGYHLDIPLRLTHQENGRLADLINLVSHSEINQYYQQNYGETLDKIYEKVKE